MVGRGNPKMQISCFICILRVNIAPPYQNKQKKKIEKSWRGTQKMGLAPPKNVFFVFLV